MSEAIEALVGQQFGNYRLMRVLGQGGFANVYLGENIYINTLAAVKVLHTQIEQSGVMRFRAEARTIAGLKHPHIVQLIDFGLEGAIPYLIINYAPNGHLRKLHPTGETLPLNIVVSYVRQIADALQFAHDHKVIHRDVKPENILLDEKNELQLSDFGIAFIVQTSHQQSTKDVTGTLAYMSPEQAQGKPGPASDQYALAIVTYELLMGERPFQGSFAEMLAQHFSARPPSLRERLPELPLAVEQVIFRALAKKPQDRFPNVSTFAVALEQASKGQNTPLAPLRQFYSSAQSTRMLPLPAPVNVAQPEQIPSYNTFYQPELGDSGELLNPAKSVELLPPPTYDVSLNTLHPAPPLINQNPRYPLMNSNHRKSFRSRHLLGISIVLTLVLVASSIMPIFAFPGLRQMLFPPNPLAAPIPTQLPTPLPVTNATLYNADWSQGLDGWMGGSEWKWIEKGLVGSDGNKSDYNLGRYRLLAPYHPLTADYAVEAQIQLVRFTSSEGDIGLLVRTDGEDNGYLCGFGVSRGVTIGQVKSGASSTSISINGPNIPLDHIYHTFRVEVKKNAITFFLDGRQLVQTTDNSYLAAGMVGLRAMNAVVDVRSFQVVKL